MADMNILITVCIAYVAFLFAVAFLADRRARQASSPAMSWDDTLGLMRALDRWRAEVGMRYDGE